MPLDGESNAKMMTRLQEILPFLQWLPSYDLRLFKWDLLAGITLASFVFPESMAYASLAGVPAQYGIYCCMAGGIFFALFTTSKQLAVGPTSAISLMIGSTVATMSGGDPQQWIQIASLTALAVALIAVIAYFLKLSVIVNFISESVLMGFKAGAALSIMSTQLPKLFGVQAGGSNFFERLYTLFQNLEGTHTAVLLFGLAALMVLIIGHFLFPGKPVSLGVVIVAILLISYTSLKSLGLELAGKMPAGLPALGKPVLHLHDVEGILGLALGCFLMGYIETISGARIFAEKYGYKINPRQELLSMAAANTASAFAGGYVVSGGLSQSTVNDKAGAKTPMSLIIHSLLLIIMLLFFTGFLKNMPEVVLAVIVLYAVSGLIKTKSLKKLYSLSKVEFTVAMVALLGVLFLGILLGVMLASLISILVIIKKATVPPVATLGLIPGTQMFSDIVRHPDNKLIPGILILRVEASLLYFNESYVYEQIIAKLDASTEKIKWLVLEMSAAPVLDVGGSKMLMNLVKELKNRDIQLRFVEALSDARDMLRKQGMEAFTGKISRKTSLYESIEELSTADEPYSV